MKYHLILDKFKELGRFHLLLAIILQIGMIESFYIVISLSVESIAPVVKCADPSKVCSIEQYCESGVNKFTNTSLLIDYDNSIYNIALKHGLYCDGEIYLRYITSTIFTSALFALMIWSVVADKAGRLNTYRLESLGLFLGFACIYWDFNLGMVFLGVALLQTCSHLFSISMLYTYEYFPENYYIILCVLHNITYGPIGLIITLYVRYTGETYSLKLLFVILSLIVFICSCIFFTESPDWLLSHYKHKKTDNEKYLVQLRETYAYLIHFNHAGETDKINSLEESFNMHLKYS
jgi:hypothetical protein